MQLGMGTYFGTFDEEFPSVSSGPTNTTKTNFLDDEGVKMFQAIFAIVTVGFVPIIIASNTLVFWGILLYPGFSTPYHVFLFSLSIADFCMGAITIPVYFRRFVLNPDDSKFVCLGTLVLKKISIDGSLWHLLVISFDRYIAVIFPVKYRDLASKGKAKKIVIFIWLYILLLMAFPMFGFNNYQSHTKLDCDYYIVMPTYYVIWSSFITKGICLAIPALLYSHISVVVYKKVRRFRRVHFRWSQYQVKLFKKRLTTLKITSALTFCFIIAWLPFLIISPFKYNTVFTESHTEMAKLCMLMLGFANAMVNAPIYAIYGKDARRVYNAMIETPPWYWRNRLHKLYEEDTSNNPISSNKASEWQTSSLNHQPSDSTT